MITGMLSPHSGPNDALEGEYFRGEGGEVPGLADGNAGEDREKFVLFSPSRAACNHPSDEDPAAAGPGAPVDLAAHSL